MCWFLAFWASALLLKALKRYQILSSVNSFLFEVIIPEVIIKDVEGKYSLFFEVASSYYDNKTSPNRLLIKFVFHSKYNASDDA